ncbi:FeoA family protein [Geomesophilobacter sediminis]|uniref:Ferrous iron transport protein A n=1 Tax=Geomesophilobacter sediminis TaxID=2798584 RepID=A0A8J7JAH0_9BACT|nr:FeoA family protein [Geomesophilobacter sediminis]MBJ6723891.1 ferrous iron transport protein A [Geomesophilobacter sediminis]
MMPLGLLGVGEHGEIAEIRVAPTLCSSGCGNERGKCDCRVEDLGIRVGKMVEMLRNAGGPILLKVDESRLALDRALAMKIMIKEVAK